MNTVEKLNCPGLGPAEYVGSLPHHLLMPSPFTHTKCVDPDFLNACIRGLIEQGKDIPVCIDYVQITAIADDGGRLTGIVPPV